MTKPTMVTAAFWTAVAGAAVLVLAAMLVFLSKNQLIELYLEANKRRQPPLAEEDVRNAATVQVWTILVGSVLFGVLSTFLAMRTRDGNPRSRTWFAVAVVLTVLFVMFLVGVIYSLFGALLMMIGLALFFTPSATRYLKSEQ